MVFLLLNELCFGHYDFELGFNEDETDDEYEWLGDENNEIIVQGNPMVKREVYEW